MGSAQTSGIHVKVLEELRNHYGLLKQPVRVIEPYQMLGLVEADLMEAIGIDVTGAWGRENMFGYSNQHPLKLSRTFWGQDVLVPEGFSTNPYLQLSSSPCNTSMCGYPHIRDNFDTMVIRSIENTNNILTDVPVENKI